MTRNRRILVLASLAAIVGHRGLSPEGPFSAKVVYGGNVLGAVAAVAGACGFVYAAFLAL